MLKYEEKNVELLKKIVCSRYVNRQVLIVRERRLTYRRATTKRFEPVTRRENASGEWSVSVVTTKRTFAK